MAPTLSSGGCHLTACQKALIGLEYERYFAEEQPAPKRDEKGQFTGRGEPAPAGAQDHPSRRRAAAVVGVGETAVKLAKALQRDAPDLAVKVQAGELSLEAADRERKKRASAAAARRRVCERLRQ